VGDLTPEVGFLISAVLYYVLYRPLKQKAGREGELELSFDER
jgi:hypothetical protein